MGAQIFGGGGGEDLSDLVSESHGSCICLAVIYLAVSALCLHISETIHQNLIVIVHHSSRKSLSFRFFIKASYSIKKF